MSIASYLCYYSQEILEKTMQEIIAMKNIILISIEQIIALAKELQSQLQTKKREEKDANIIELTNDIQQVKSADRNIFICVYWMDLMKYLTNLIKIIILNTFNCTTIINKIILNHMCMKHSVNNGLIFMLKTFQINYLISMILSKFIFEMFIQGNQIITDKMT
ncbi:hypothetical protein RFI_03323 [Reticulomyxa filosa]|uniref:Uncharacterized protein n=1 Tax=Reticulomyxa filosa TaxID=46433 RepID=X6P6R3_RETFI|nr:hypothetical protein RFI_03323 [Reticulomyxa filosa]|eukprot:ETO33779.1 hypothetical protein RFI_03323 [Reticulomyxa filosa]